MLFLKSNYQGLRSEFQMMGEKSLLYDPNAIKNSPIFFFFWKFLENQRVQMGFSKNQRVQLHPLRPL